MAETNHTPGCPAGRTGRCTCEYLSGWGEPQPEPERPGHTHICLEEFWPEECVCDSGKFTDTICCHRKTGWHRTDQASCDYWDKLVEYRRSAYGEEVIENGYGHSDDIHPKYQLEEALEQQKHREEEILRSGTAPEPVTIHHPAGFTATFVPQGRATTSDPVTLHSGPGVEVKELQHQLEYQKKLVNGWRFIALLTLFTGASANAYGIGHLVGWW